MRYKAVLFDLDGTLLNSGHDLVVSVQHALRVVDGEREPPGAQEILIHVGQSLESLYRDLGYRDGSGEEALFADAFRAHYYQHFNDTSSLYPRVEETIAALRAAGVRLAVVTTKHQTQADFVMEWSGLGARMDYVWGWMEGRHHKPHPEPVETALAALGVESDRALMVGDAEMDVLAAKAAGVDACACTYGFRPVSILEALSPEYMIDGIEELVPIVLGG